MKAFLYFAAFFVGWAASYASGAWPWLGYASLTRSSFGVGPVTVIGENRRGIDVGLESFLFFEGQEIVIEYDAVIRTGSLWFYVFQPFDGEFGKGKSNYITQTGKGVWTHPIDETGYYKISIDASPRGNGYDLSYTVKWGARSAGSASRPVTAGRPSR